MRAPEIAAAWPGLSPASLFAARKREMPFPLGAPRSMYFFRARNAIYHLARALDLRGKTVLLPDYHSGSEVWAVRSAGANVRFFRIDRQLEPDLDHIRDLCKSEKPAALLAIHYNGWPQPVDDLVAICAEHRMTLIEDCAHAMLSANGNRPLGTYGQYAVFCLYKSVPVPNGAALVCNESVPRPLSTLALAPAGALSVSGRTAELMLTWLQARAPKLAVPMFAAKRQAARFLNAAHLERMPIGEVGFDIDSVNAAISPLSLALLETFDYDAIARKRRQNFEFLRARLDGCADALRADLPEGMCPLFFPIVAGDKASAAADLRAAGIGVIETWNYGDDEARGGDAEWLRAHVLELPIHPDLTTNQLNRIAAAVARLHGH